MQYPDIRYILLRNAEAVFFTAVKCISGRCRFLREVIASPFKSLYIDVSVAVCRILSECFLFSVFTYRIKLKYRSGQRSFPVAVHNIALFKPYAAIFRIIDHNIILCIIKLERFSVIIICNRKGIFARKLPVRIPRRTLFLKIVASDTEVRVAYNTFCITGNIRDFKIRAVLAGSGLIQSKYRSLERLILGGISLNKAYRSPYR